MARRGEGLARISEGPPNASLLEAQETEVVPVVESSGCCCCALSEEQMRSRLLDKAMAEDAEEDEELVKLLLLGAGESGKSTIFKQFEILFGEGFNEEQRLQHRRFIRTNILQTVQVLQYAAQELGLLGSVSNTRAFELCAHVDPTLTLVEFTPELGRAIGAMWAEEAIKEVWRRRSNFQLLETVGTFLDKVDEIAQDEYVPTVDDVLLCRVRTSGLVEKRYNIHESRFVMLDVGGQRNERRKWLGFFEGVDAVIFVAALSEYDQVLFEDEVTNRMLDALALFDYVCNNKFFVRTSMLLFLNKDDLFREKIARVSIQSLQIFDDYTGAPHDYDGGVEYFRSRFLSCNRSPEEREIFSHVTTATSTENISFVFESCRETILDGNLDRAGFGRNRDV